MTTGPTQDPKQFRDPNYLHYDEVPHKRDGPTPTEAPKPPAQNMRAILAGMLHLLKADHVELPYEDINGPLSERPIAITDDEEQGVVRISLAPPSQSV